MDTGQFNTSQLNTGQLSTGQLNTMSAEPIQAVDPMAPRWHRILQRRRENHDTFTLELTPVDQGAAMAFAPGQFNMLYVFGVGEIPISISGDPGQPERLIHTTRAVGTVTRAMSRLGKGDVLGVRGPFGSAWPLAQAEGRDVVIVTGGIGLAPLRPAIYQLLAQREKYARIVILYGALTQEDMVFRRELERWSARLDVEVFATVDRATSGWRGNVGVVTTLIPHAPFDPDDTIALVCGPEVMMRYTVAALEKRGLTHEQIYLSMERNMKCAVGFCGHCQFGPKFICKDGPVFRFDQVRAIFGKWEV